MTATSAEARCTTQRIAGLSGALEQTAELRDRVQELETSPSARKTVFRKNG
ncbi:MULTISPECIES: hypothetical protein [unclassified Streptomyces]|uniref:hypothetical protein n=1 Tax=unclassified Streptomyces TaxID=2593676 RepID=UPI0013691850|nr:MULTISPECIES: hypothetical protein [unclassified Streptomyces]MYS20296.1 hypothetical protein [Streptomyces sp. SID4948]